MHDFDALERGNRIFEGFGAERFKLARFVSGSIPNVNGVAVFQPPLRHSAAESSGSEQCDFHAAILQSKVAIPRFAKVLSEDPRCVRQRRLRPSPYDDTSSTCRPRR